MLYFESQTLMEVVSVDYKEINDYLVGIFNNVLIIEEASLKTSRFKDVSIKEMHTIDEIGNTPKATPSDIAKALMLTLGTVTTSLNKLEKKVTSFEQGLV